jgi:hypothetical protein
MMGVGSGSTVSGQLPASSHCGRSAREYLAGTKGKEMARMEGFEPPTAWFVARYSIQLSYMRVLPLIGEGVDYGEFSPVRQSPEG